jgi:hypothetical protein
MSKTALSFLQDTLRGLKAARPSHVEASGPVTNLAGMYLCGECSAAAEGGSAGHNASILGKTLATQATVRPRTPFCHTCGKRFFGVRCIDIAPLPTHAALREYLLFGDPTARLRSAASIYSTAFATADASDRGTVKSYEYKPLPTFIGEASSGGYLGLEFELSTRPEALNPEGTYKKEDSSIQGFELVSEPLAIAELMTGEGRAHETLSAICGWIDEHADTDAACGVHFHISRRHFKTGAHLLRFAHAVNSRAMRYAHAPVTNRHANRAHRATYCAFQSGTNFLQSVKGHDTPRTRAVNLSGLETVEVRFYDAEAKGLTLRAQIQHAIALIEFTRTTKGCRHITVTNFKSWLAGQEVKYPDYLELAAHMRQAKEIAGEVALCA